MADDITLSMRMQKKKRSASICATGGSIENAIYNIPSGSNTPESQGTPSYRRRRPATRSQSARIANTAGRSVRRRPHQQQQQQQMQHNLHESRSYCTSEPKLSETETLPQRRNLSQKKPQHHAHRKSNAYLDVPTSDMYHLRLSDDQNLDCLRTFSTSKSGIINRGDSFRRRPSRSNSLSPVSPIHPRIGALAGCIEADIYSNVEKHQHMVVAYHVAMLGAPGVGKQALLAQFRTSDCINAYDGPESDETEQRISIILNSIESELKIVITTSTLKDELEKVDAFLIVYSCVDKDSFSQARQTLSRIQDMDLIKTRPIVLVANKIDLARSRAISAQDGKCLACTYGAKFIEVSAAINHNCDELLVGTLTQIRMKKEQVSSQSRHDTSPSPSHWYNSRSVTMASMKARQMMTWLFGKEDSKFKNCENLQIL